MSVPAFPPAPSTTGCTEINAQATQAKGRGSVRKQNNAAKAMKMAAQRIEIP